MSRRPRSGFELRTMALEAALVEKGLISTDAVDAFVETVETRMGPHLGARVVALAWTDPAYKQRLLADAPAAMAELGIAGPQGDDLRVVENTADVHNVVVCTLCSCYPWALLGLPPTWYKDFAYRSRTVARPRAVLSEFGTELDPDVEVRVWDSERVDALFRPAGASRRHGGPRRGRVGRPRHSRHDDRREEGGGADLSDAPLSRGGIAAQTGRRDRHSARGTGPGVRPNTRAGSSRVHRRDDRRHRGRDSAGTP